MPLPAHDEQQNYRNAFTTKGIALSIRLRFVHPGASNQALSNREHDMFPAPLATLGLFGVPYVLRTVQKL